MASHGFSQMNQYVDTRHVYYPPQVLRGTEMRVGLDGKAGTVNREEEPEV